MILTRDRVPVADIDAAATSTAAGHLPSNGQAGALGVPATDAIGRAGVPVMDDAAVANRYAVIDVGTNSVKFLVAERDGLGGWRTLVERSEVTRLGQGLNASGEIGAKGTARTARAIRAMLDEATSLEVGAIAAVGTAGLRLAANRDAVVAELTTRTGVAVQVIDGDEEGRLAYRAVEAGLANGTGTLVVFSTGGGSSQFTFGHAGAVDERFSVDVGAVRTTERFGLAQKVSAKRLRQARATIAADLAPLVERSRPDHMVAMGGAVTTLASVAAALPTPSRELVEGATLDRAEVERQIELYRTHGSAKRRAMPGLQPKRADVILAGACIVAVAMDLLGQETAVVSSLGLRHGLMRERFGR